MHDEIHYESENKEKEKYGLIIKTIIAIIIMNEAHSVIDIGFLLFLASSIRSVTCLILKHSLIIPPTKETKAYKQSESVCVCIVYQAYLRFTVLSSPTAPPSNSGLLRNTASTHKGTSTPTHYSKHYRYVPAFSRASRSNFSCSYNTRRQLAVTPPHTSLHSPISLVPIHDLFWFVLIRASTRLVLTSNKWISQEQFCFQSCLPVSASLSSSLLLSSLEESSASSS